MIPPATTVPELLQRLRRTFSPFERLKILGSAWVLLHRMSPQERLTVAAQLGLDNADELVEAIAARSGTKASPALLSMIDQAQKKGTGQLPQLLSDLKDPSKRTERLRQGVAAAEAALVAKPAQAPWLPANVAKPEGTKPPPLPAPAPPPARQAPPAPVAAAAPPLVSEPTPRPAAPPAAPAPAPTAAATAPPSPPVVHEKPPAAPAPAAAPRPSPPSPPPPAPSPKPAPEPPAQPTEAAPTVEVEPNLHLMDRFRQLRRKVSDSQKLKASSLRSLVESFPDGWARRRALVELLRAGSPAALPDALALLDTLGSDRDRLWCLGTLAERELAAADREALLTAAPSPTARRRLERRMGER